MESTLAILQDIAQNLLAVVPNILKALLVLLVGWIIARLVAGIVRRVLSKIGIDKLAEKLNEIDLISKSSFTFVPSSFLAKLLYYIILLVFIMAAAEVLGMAEVSKMVSNIVNYIPQLISAGIVMVFGLLLADFVKNMVLTACKSLGVPSAGIIAGFVFWFVFLIAIVSALSQAGIETSFITIAISTVIGGIVFAFAIGYGLASKGLMANFLASFYSKDRFEVGDVISINGIKGEVLSIDNSSIVLRADGRRVIIPLSKLSTETVEIFEE